MDVRTQIRAWDMLGGRPPKFGASDAHQLRKWVRYGEPEAVVAKRLHISVSTLDRYLTR